MVLTQVIMHQVKHSVSLGEWGAKALSVSIHGLKLYSLKYLAPECSFAPVVLLLKVLLGQQALDKPFTGGLGSYKLYVLVGSHVSPSDKVCSVSTSHKSILMAL